jgi:hypothetical protein
VDRSDLQGSGDYGYDLAHEDLRKARRGPEPRSSGEHQHHGRPPRRDDSDRSEDLAYDEAHDF